MHNDEDERPTNLPKESASRPGLRHKSTSRLDRAIQDQIGQELRKFYAEALNEPVPERLLALLKGPGKQH